MSDILRNKIDKLLPVDEVRIFPITPAIKAKPLELKDYIEIWIRYSLMWDKKILNFWVILFKTEAVSETVNLYPLSLYKLLIYYEKLSLFEALYRLENRRDKVIRDEIVQASFASAIIMNNFNVAIYIFKKFDTCFVDKTEVVLDSLVNIMREFIKVDSSRLQLGVPHFEELLYFLGFLVKNANKTQAYHFVSICYNLLEPQSLDEEEVDDEHLENVKKGVIENQVRGHFLTYSTNPIKIWVLIMELCFKIAGNHPLIIQGVKKMSKKYYTMIEVLVDSYQGSYHKLKFALLGK